MQNQSTELNSHMLSSDSYLFYFFDSPWLKHKKKINCVFCKCQWYLTELMEYGDHWSRFLLMEIEN